MVEEVEKILSNGIQAVIKSPELSLSLLRCYSKLYLHGGQPRACESSQRKYYNDLKQTGMKKAALQEKIDKRTCKPAFNGLRYIRSIHKHVMSAYMHDQEAIQLLESGALKESDFEVLPEGYKKPAAKAPQAEKAAPKKRGPKPKKKTE